MDGIIIINKEIGLTSQQVVSKVKRTLNVKKAGHTGTLDPMATGVLPVLIGKATKLSSYMIEHDKKYVATVCLGEKRDTGDREGNVIERKEVPSLNEEKIISVLNLFKGDIKQIPPMYSAIKVNGKKLYEYARNGENVERQERDIHIYDIKFIEFLPETNEIKFEVFCSKGTYIRVLCEDIAEKLNTVGYMSSLNRIEVSSFKLEDSIKIEELSEREDYIISIEKFFENKNSIIVEDKKIDKFLNGVKLKYELCDGIYRIYSEKNQFLGTGIMKEGFLKRDIIL